MARFLIYFLFPTLLALPAASQSTGSVSGFVRDASTGETLILANVVLAGTTYGSASNTAGFYVLTGIPVGSYELRTTYLGYDTFTENIVVSSESPLRLDIELTPTQLLFEAVTIVADRDRTDDERQLGFVSLSTAKVAELPSVLEPDVFRSLQLLPGIKASSDYSSGLYIRGGTPDQTLILLDQTTVYNPSHFFGFFSTFNADALKDIRVLKGGYNAEYGGRIGSVIDLYNKDGNRRRTGGRVSLGLLASRVLLEGPYGKGSYMFAFRRSTVDPLLNALRDQDIDGIPDLFYFYDLNAKVNLDLSADDRLSIATYVGQDQLDLELFADAGVQFRYGNRTLSTHWTHLLSPTVFSSLTVTSSHYFSEPVFEFATTTFTRDNTVDDVSLKADVEVLTPNNLSFKAGTWMGFFTMRLQDRFDDLESLSERIHTGYGSAYVQLSYPVGLRWTIVSGLRGSYFAQGNYLRVEPRLSLEYLAHADLRFQFSAGRYHQFLTLITNEAFTGFDIWLTSDKGVPPAYGDQFVVGANWSRPGGISIDFEVYYRTMNDLFELDPFLPDVAGLAYEDLFQFGTGWAYGAELFIERSIGRLNGFVGYTFGVTRRRFENLNDNRAFPPKYDRTHDLKLVTNYELGRKWQITTAWTYATGQAYTEPASTYRLVDFPFRSDSPNAIVSPFNRARLPVYHRLDVGFDKRGRFFGFADYTLRLQVINAYNRRNIWFYFFEFEDDDTVKRTEVPQIPVPIPNFSLTLDF